MGIFESFKKKARADKAGAPLPQPPAEPARVIRVSDYLTKDAIFFFPAGPSKQQVFGQLIGSLNLPDPSGALQAIMAREEAGSTVIAPGLALPHARIPGIARIAAAVAVCPTGVIDPHATGEPIHLFVLFLGPANNMREHLAFLAAVSSLFQQEGLAPALLQIATPAAVLDKIREAEIAF